MADVALKRKFDTLLYDDTHFNEGRYSDGDKVIADPNGLGEESIFTYDSSGDKATANLGANWDPNEAAGEQGQGLGNGTGTGLGFFVRNRPVASFKHFQYDGELDQTKAMRDALEDTFQNKSRREIYIPGQESWYEVGDIDPIPNATGSKGLIRGDGSLNSVISFVGTEDLFGLGHDGTVTSLGLNEFAFTLDNLGITTKTGRNCVAQQWRFPGVLVKECQIEGFDTAIGPVLGQVPGTTVDDTETKSWSMTVFASRLYYNRVGVRNHDHVLNVFGGTRIFFGETGVLLDDTNTSSGAALTIQGNAIVAMSNACVHLKDSNVAAFSIENNNFENGRNNVNFTSTDAIDSTQQFLVTPAPIIKLENSGSHSTWIRSNTMSTRAATSAIEIVSEGGSEGLSLNIVGNSASSDPNSGSYFVNVSGTQPINNNNSCYGNFSSTQAFSGGVTNDETWFDILQHSMRITRPKPFVADVLDITDFEVTKHFKEWVNGGGTNATEDPVTAMVGPTTVCVLEDAQAGGNSQRTLDDTNTGDCIIRFKVRINGQGGFWRINRQSTGGTAIMFCNHNNGNISFGGNSGAAITVLKSSVDGEYLTAWVRFEGLADNTGWDIRPHTSGVGILEVEEWEMYAEDPNFEVAAPVQAAIDDGSIQYGAGVSRADLQDATSAVNTVGKYAGKMVYEAAGGTPNGLGRPVWARGSAATDPWDLHNATALRTPA